MTEDWLTRTLYKKRERYSWLSFIIESSSNLQQWHWISLWPLLTMSSSPGGYLKEYSCLLSELLDFSVKPLFVGPRQSLNCIEGNLITVSVIYKYKAELGLKVSFRRLICQLCVLDTLCIIFNILMFSGPWHSEHYRHQVVSQESSERVTINCWLLRCCPS